MTVIESFDTGAIYRLTRKLGEGGFAEVWAAETQYQTPSHPDSICIKISENVTAWHREAYIGELMRKHDGAIAMYGTFVGHRREGRKKGQPLYCTLFALAESSVLSALENGGLRWDEPKLLEEFRRVVSAVQALHSARIAHRDITPMNVLLTRNRQLKLADFGIATGDLAKDRRTADAFNRWFAPPRIMQGRRHWELTDDVWQLGMLLAWLVQDVPIERKLTPSDIRKLECSDTTKQIILTCLEDREYRVRDASALLRFLDEGMELTYSRPTTLHGKTIIFTGPAPLPRAEMRRAAERAGAIVVESMSRRVEAVVVGAISPAWAGGTAGRKLLAAMRYRDEGVPVQFVRAERLLALAGKRR